MHTRLNNTLLTLVLAASLLVGVQAAEPKNLSTLKAEISTYLDTGAYTKQLESVASTANRFLEKRIAKGAPAGKKLAIVFDIDETTLSNVSHMRENDYGYIPVAWDKWVDDANAPAIAPVKTIYDTAVRGGVTVFFITGRKESGRAGTEKNLRAVGYTTWARTYFKANDAKESSGAFKLALRKQLEAEGFVIIANVGDQNSDFFGGHSERNFKLPNPFYLVD